MTLVARCLVPLPIAGSGPVATTARSHRARWVTICNQPLLMRLRVDMTTVPSQEEYRSRHYLA